MAQLLCIKDHEYDITKKTVMITFSEPKTQRGNKFLRGEAVNQSATGATGIIKGVTENFMKITANVDDSGFDTLSPIIGNKSEVIDTPSNVVIKEYVKYNSYRPGANKVGDIHAKKPDNWIPGPAYSCFEIKQVKESIAEIKALEDSERQMVDEEKVKQQKIKVKYLLNFDIADKDYYDKSLSDTTSLNYPPGVLKSLDQQLLEGLE